MNNAPITYAILLCTQTENVKKNDVENRTSYVWNNGCKKISKFAILLMINFEVLV